MFTMLYIHRVFGTKTSIWNIFKGWALSLSPSLLFFFPQIFSFSKFFHNNSDELNLVWAETHLSWKPQKPYPTQYTIGLGLLCLLTSFPLLLNFKQTESYDKFTSTRIHINLPIPKTVSYSPSLLLLTLLILWNACECVNGFFLGFEISNFSYGYGRTKRTDCAIRDTSSRF